MNYLAHVLLAGDGEEARIGGILGDFVKGSPEGLFPPDTVREILLHRRLDTRTDAHPAFREARGSFAEGHRRFAGVALDVFFDHALASTWDRWCKVDLRAFTHDFYASLERHKAVLPERFTRIMPSLVAHDWLASYRDYANVELAVQRMARRMRRGEGLVACLGDIDRAYPSLIAAFESLFPDLLAYAAEERQRMRSGTCRPARTPH